MVGVLVAEEGEQVQGLGEPVGVVEVAQVGVGKGEGLVEGGLFKWGC